MKFAFATFQGGHEPLKFIAFEKSGKKKNVTLLFGEVFVDVTLVVTEVSRYFQPGAPVSTQMTSPSQASYNINFSSIFFIFYHNETASSWTVIFSRYCFTSSLYLFASCFIFFTPKNI